ncbi:MAG: DNA polymerase III subunit delta [Deltaproteobacteria bacterium]|nr:DNA polymerase III subunit delta [Deltaproteobacteria bacterium]
MNISTLIAAARDGKFPPIVVLVGAERFLIERATGLLKVAALGDGPAGFNDDIFHGRGLDAKRVSAAARTLPMMANARYVLVRDAHQVKDLDPLVEYLDDPSPTSCVVISGDKLDGRSRFVKAAKKKKVYCEAKAVKPGELRNFASNEAQARGHSLEGPASQALVDSIGADLAAIDDALERLSLFVGAGAAIDIAAVEACVTRVRTDSIWALVDAVSVRNLPRALAAASSLLADREPPLRILAMVARQVRMVAKMREALASGLKGPEAAKRAGAPPFKARELTEAARRFRMTDLENAFRTLAQADLALKGAKRPHGRVLEEAIMALCTPGMPAAIASARP